ncbi:MAG: alpha/beta hydrolase [Flavisolibacter sp.]
MISRRQRIIRRTVITILIVYLAGGFLLYLFQDRLIFHPEPLSKEHNFSFDQPYEELNLPFGKDNLNIVKFKTAEPRKGIVLFFHGNMKNVEHYKQYPILFTKNGYEIWMIDYPGYGKTTGKRTEKIMYDQSIIMYAKAANEISSDSILIYGKSLGTGVASYLASEKKSRWLILETPYYSIDELAGDLFPMYSFIPLTRYSFPNGEYLKKINIPTIIIHGTKDKIVPYHHGKKLAEENQHVEFVTLENGSHNDLFGFDLYQKKMDSVLRE